MHVFVCRSSNTKTRESGVHLSDTYQTPNHAFEDDLKGYSRHRDGNFVFR